MGPASPLEQLGIGTTPSQAQLDNAVNTLQPYAGIYKQQNFSAPQFSMPQVTGSGSSASNFFHTVGSIFGESAHMFEGAGEWLVRQVGHAASSVFHEVPSVVRVGEDLYHYGMSSWGENSLMNQIEAKNKQLDNGQISQDTYKSDMQQINKQLQSSTGQMGDYSHKLSVDGNIALQNTINTAAVVATILSDGLAAPLLTGVDAGTASAADFLASRAATELFSPAEDQIARIATDAKLMQMLPAYVQNGVKASVTDVFMNVGATVTSGQIARATAVNMFLKFPIGFNYLSGTGQQVAAELEKGNYSDAIKTMAFNAAMYYAGGPLGKAIVDGGLGKITVAKFAAFGQSSFLDTLSKYIGEGNVNGLYEAIKSNPAMIRAFQALEATNMNAEGGNAMRAALRIVDGLKANGWDLKQATHEQFVQDVMGWHQAQTLLHDALIKAGYSEADASKYVVGRWNTLDKQRLADILTQRGSVDARLKVWEEYKQAYPNSAFANNENLDRQIQQVIRNNEDPGKLEDAIKGIKAQYNAPGLLGAGNDSAMKALFSRMGKLGYVAINPKVLEAPFIQGEQRLVTSAAENSEFFQRAVAAKPIMKEFGAALTKIGLSPTQTNEATSFVFAANLRDSLINKSIAGDDVGARAVVSKLQNYINQVNRGHYGIKFPISDMRQLTVKDIQKALDLTSSDAKDVGRAINQSMMKMTWAERGMGPKAQDILQAFRSGRKLSMSGYLRLQNTFRFAWNPFFQAKLSIKGEILSELAGGGRVSALFRGKYGDLKDTAKMLEDRGFFGGGFANEAYQENAFVKQMTRPIGITEGQKMSIAGLISAQAEHVGMDVNTFIDNFSSESRDTIDTILHYNPKSDLLNSPLVRTLNMAFFPARFELKVASAIGKALMKTDSLTRVGVIYGMYEAHNFLTSEQGQLWYQQNASALKLLNYFTPLQELNVVSAIGGIFTGENPSVGAFGELGGLPLGFIPQLLQNEGMWSNESPAYLDPKTGQQVIGSVPADAKAQLATAISTFIMSVWTYPGSELGLPSSTKVTNTLAKGMTGANKADYTPAQPGTLTPQQQAYQQAIQSIPGNQQHENNVNDLLPIPEGTGGITQSTQSPFKVPSPIYSSRSGRAKKLKKTQEPLLFNRLKQ